MSKWIDDGTAIPIRRGGGVMLLVGMWMILTGFGAPGSPGDCRVTDADFQSAGGGCTDSQSGRSWDASSVFNGSGYVSWSYFKDFCKNRVAGGFDDWRLPTKAELEALTANETLVPSGDPSGDLTTAHVVTGSAQQWKWSSDGVGSKKWAVNMYGGSRLIQTKPAGLVIEGICVR